MYAELEVHRTMIRDRVRTEAFQRAIESVVRPGDVVLDLGAGSGILSVFAARAGAACVYAVERTTVAAVAQQLAAANGAAEIVRVFHGDVTQIELPGRVDVIVSERLGGFGIDEGMLGPVIAARDRWLKPGGVMIPRLVTAWTALVEDRYSGEMARFLRDNPYGLNLDGLAEMTVNEIFYSGTFRHLAAGDRRSGPGRLWATDAELIPLGQAQAPHQAETLLPVREHGTANALALWFSAGLAPGISLSVGPGDAPTHWGMTTAPLRCPVQLAPGMVVRARVRTVPARPGRDMDELGRRAARRGLGGARRAGRLAGDRRLNQPRNLTGRTCAADPVARGSRQRSWQRPFRAFPGSCRGQRGHLSASPWKVGSAGDAPGRSDVPAGLPAPDLGATRALGAVSPAPCWLPGQLDFEFGAVVLELEFHFQVDLIGDVRDEPHVLPLDHDIIAGRQLVSDCVQARGRLLPGQHGLFLQLHQFHVSLRSLADGLVLTRSGRSPARTLAA